MSHRRNLTDVVVDIVSATKQREPLILPAFDETLRELVVIAARKVGGTVLAAGNADDHIHVVTRIASTTGLSTLVQSIKGGSGHDWNAMHAATPIYWQYGYWAESITPSAVPSVCAYVRVQRVRHAKPGPLEEWERWYAATVENAGRGREKPSAR